MLQKAEAYLFVWPSFWKERFKITLLWCCKLMCLAVVEVNGNLISRSVGKKWKAEILVTDVGRSFFEATDPES